MSEIEAPGGRDEDLLYVEIALDIEGRIIRQELMPGARLRSERSLAEFYKVSYGTIRRAMNYLRARDLIETIHGRGTFVKRTPKPPHG